MRVKKTKFCFVVDSVHTPGESQLYIDYLHANKFADDFTISNYVTEIKMEGCYNLQPKSLSLFLSNFAKYAKRIYLYSMFRHADKNEILDLSFYSGNAEQFELLSFWGAEWNFPAN